MDEEEATPKQPRWLVLLGIPALVVALLAAMLFVLSRLQIPTPLAAETESSNTQVIESLTLEEDIVLLSLGIQGIAEERIRSTIFGLDVPGSERATFLQYSYQAKLGIDGGAVEIRQTSDTSYQVIIPEFEFLGHDDAEFRTVVEDNGILSFATPEIDTAAAITRILDDEARQKHIDDNGAILRDQAEAFYGGLIHSIDPELDVNFAFRSGR